MYKMSYDTSSRCKDSPVAFIHVDAVQEDRYVEMLCFLYVLL